MQPPSITLYIDIVSPFAYLSFITLLRSPALLPLTTVIPVFLGGIMHETSNRPPLSVPAKGIYTFHDLRRQARANGIPLGGMPEGFPLNTLAAQRALCGLQRDATREEFLEKVRALYEALWVHGKSVDREEVLTGLLGEEVMRVAKTEEVKERLAANTKEALAKGAFGLPWFVVRKDGVEDVFWGFDHLEQVKAYVNGGEMARL